MSPVASVIPAEEAPVALVRLDHERCVVSVDASAARLLGPETSDLGGRSFDELISPADRRGLERYLHHLTSGDRDRLDLLVTLRLDRVDVSVRLRLVPAADGWSAWIDVVEPTDPVGTLVTGALYSRASVAASSDGIAQLDHAGRIVEHNPAFLRLMAFRSEHGVSLSEERLWGRAFFELARHGVFEPLKVAFESPRPRARRFSGSLRHDRRLLHVTMSPTFSAARQFLGAALVVKDRTNDEEVERLRVASARAAGRSEVATNVLHNVGNVLNSINVGASVVDDGLARLRIDAVRSVGALLGAHEGALCSALGEERGARLAPFVDAVHDQLDTAVRDLRQEIGRLRAHVDHVKQIVAAQQSHAGKGDGRELVAPRELCQMAVAIAGLARSSITLNHAFEVTGAELVDRHRVVEILVNLLANARNALVEHGTCQPTIWLSLRRAADGLQFTVRDNGPGIGPEHLSLLFQHGFTTRSTGHGFGLHASANAATELGGRLEAHSDGPGLGATFRLVVPTRIRETP